MVKWQWNRTNIPLASFGIVYSKIETLSSAWRNSSFKMLQSTTSNIKHHAHHAHHAPFYSLLSLISLILLPNGGYWHVLAAVSSLSPFSSLLEQRHLPIFQTASAAFVLTSLRRVWRPVKWGCQLSLTTGVIPCWGGRSLPNHSCLVSEVRCTHSICSW